MNLNSIKAFATRKFGRTVFLAKKYSPEILVGVGIVGFGATVVLVGKQTTKAEKLLDDAKAKLDIIHEAEAKYNTDEYSVTERQTDVLTVYVQTGFEFVKLYGPSATLFVLSTASIATAFGIMKRRNLAMVAAYKVLEQGFADYRGRVVEEYGEDKDRELRYGVKKKTVTTTVVDPETGEKVKVKKDIWETGVVDPGVYARFFDDLNPLWDKDSAEFNFTFLWAQQQGAEMEMHKYGYISLNDVYKRVGIKPIPDGQLMGWVDNANRDKKIDFGLFECHNPNARAFVNREAICFLMNFNVDPEPMYVSI
jgi:hypothetical protein